MGAETNDLLDVLELVRQVSANLTTLAVAVDQLSVRVSLLEREILALRAERSDR